MRKKRWKDGWPDIMHLMVAFRNIAKANKNFLFRPPAVCVYFIRISEQTVIISLHSIN